MKKKSIAVVIISNGPGELSTWVKPVVEKINLIHNSLDEIKNLSFDIRLILVPCPNATGKEYEVAKSWNHFELITKPKLFWKLLIKPSSYADWPKQGIIIFLGGDQFWSVLLAKRLGYMNITYAEWIARWPQWTDIIAAMNVKVKENLPEKFRTKCKIIGDLMADITDEDKNSETIPDRKFMALLPGSKKAKLSVGIPYFLEIADHIYEKNKSINLIIPMAPTTNINEYLFFQSDKNPIAKFYYSKIKKIKKINHTIFDYVIETSKDTKIYLINKHPCYEILKECDLAITTVGANTAELAALSVPMIVVLPTQHLSVMNAWDGIFGIIGKISFLNKFFTLLLKNLYFKNKRFFAWPNIKAKKLIVPERIGNIQPKEIAKEALYLIDHQELLKEQKNNLLQQRGNAGAVEKLAYIIINSIKKIS